MYLFDTDIITNIFKKQPFPGLLIRLANIPRNQQHISTITVSEIVYGAYKSDRPDYHLSNLQNILLPAVNILGFDSKAAYVCGRIRAELEKAGTPLALADLEIAAISLANKLVLVTGNSRHFDRISGLTVQNWLL
jgi:tRNA(fMet)-specific endonuclease VapC